MKSAAIRGNGTVSVKALGQEGASCVLEEEKRPGGQRRKWYEVVGTGWEEVNTRVQGRRIGNGNGTKC